ncbi:MAG: hypothetical protein WC934_14820 [Acidithiobacillus sp.]|jgi:hypothetical protein|uniref:hypothetical protein n=1 Tax=Acidithiobacillus sp. TaxID=1872118 RepID=UPI00355DC496
MGMAIFNQPEDKKTGHFSILNNDVVEQCANFCGWKRKENGCWNNNRGTTLSSLPKEVYYWVNEIEYAMREIIYNYPEFVIPQLVSFLTIIRKITK